jgi:CarD family transcriptional regulator
MNYEIGHTLVYPHHGAATITDVVVRSIQGVDTTYITLAVNASDLVISLPAASIEAVGVRDVIDHDGVLAVYAVLGGAVGDESLNWTRRFKANQEKMPAATCSPSVKLCVTCLAGSNGPGFPPARKRCWCSRDVSSSPS